MLIRAPHTYRASEAVRAPALRLAAYRNIQVKIREVYAA